MLDKQLTALEAVSLQRSIPAAQVVVQRLLFNKYPELQRVGLNVPVHA